MDEITILLVDDEEDLLVDIREYFEAYPLTTYADPQQACVAIKQRSYDILIVDYRMPKMSGIEVLIEAKKAQAYTYGILFTAYAEKELLEDVINKNLVHKVVGKPLKLKQLQAVVDEAICTCHAQKEAEQQLDSLKQECEQLKQALTQTRHPVIGLNNGLKQVFQQVQAVALHPINVLLTGETGTGKEVIAQLLHALSPRKDQRFIKVNCAAIPDHLLESELFGYTKGAFTGASSDKPGKIELAHEGTLFLDEIGEMKVALQAKLLRVLQEKDLERLGSNKRITVDFRLIVATNRDLHEHVSNKLLREDLYYRINTFPIHVPPLRDRREDIPDLLRYFLEKGCQELGIQPLAIGEPVVKRLQDYRWPGNVRELENAVMRALITSLGHTRLEESAFDFLCSRDRDLEQSGAIDEALQVLRNAVIDRCIGVKDIEKLLLNSILEYYEGNVAHAVKHTGILKDRFYRSRKDLVDEKR
jgi:DNA-binding NtrC family response regulator